MPRKKIKKKAAKRKTKTDQFARDGRKGLQLRDHILKIVQEHPKKAIHQDTLIARLAKLGYKLRMQNIGRSLFTEPKLVRENRVIRLATGPEKAARTSEVELALKNQSDGIRSRAAARRDAPPGEKRASVRMKPNVPAAREVLNAIIETDNLPDDARQSLLVTIRRLLGGEA